MRTPQKVAVIGLFLLGGFTAITGIIRLHFLTYAYASLKHPLYNDVTCKWLFARLIFSTNPDDAQTASPLHPTGRLSRRMLAF